VKDGKKFADGGGWGCAVFDYDTVSDAFKPGARASNPSRKRDSTEPTGRVADTELLDPSCGISRPAPFHDSSEALSADNADCDPKRPRRCLV